MPRKMKVLIAYDGSECADRALFDLKRAGIPRDVEAVVISLADVWLPPEGPRDPNISEWLSRDIESRRGELLKVLEEAHAFAVQASQRVRAQFPDGTVQAEAYADSPAWGIIKKADQWKPDLIVMGSHGRSALGRVMIGSVSHTVLTHVNISVRIARGHTEEHISPVRIIVGLDGSPEADRAVHAVSTRAWSDGTAVHLIAAVDTRMATAVTHPDSPAGRWVDASDKDSRAWIKRMVEASATLLRARGLIVSCLVKEGDPKHVLVEEARRWGADCIFVGSRGLTAGPRFLLGSVAAAVAARAHCSVEVVRV